MRTRRSARTFTHKQILGSDPVMTRRNSQPFFSWRETILKSSLPSTTKHLLLTLACHMNDAGESCYPSIELLHKEMTLSKRSVITHLKLASRLGWIGVRTHGFAGQGWARNEYYIKWPDDAEGGEAGAPPSSEKVVKDVHRLTHEGGEGRSPPLPPKVVKDVHRVNGEGGERSDTKVVNYVHPSTSVNSSVVTNTSSRGDEVCAVGAIYRTKRKRKLHGWHLTTFDRFWSTFAYPHGKAEAADAWLDIEGLDAVLAERIIEAAAIAARERAAIVKRGGTPKWAQGWLNARRWEDIANARTPTPRTVTARTAPTESPEAVRRHVEKMNAQLRSMGKPELPLTVEEGDA